MTLSAVIAIGTFILPLAAAWGLVTYAVLYFGFENESDKKKTRQ